MGDLSEHFSRSEFTCRCGCGFADVEKILLEGLELARKDHGRIRVTSGCRCAPHNHNVGGKSTSSHLGGWAVDIACVSSQERFSLIRALCAAGFERLGIGPDFIHVDADPAKPPCRIWLYPGLPSTTT